MMLFMPAVQPTDHAKTPSGRGAAVPLSDPSHETSKRLKSNAVSDPRGSSGSDGPRDLPAVPLPALSRVVAPMVGASDLAFRKLCRRHGATLAYTEMLCARRFVEDAAYRFSLFESQRCMLNDRPLIVQFCGNDASSLAAAAALAVGQHGVDGVDLNLGCPQKRAKEALYGSYLLDTEHWPRVFSCVRAMAAAAAPVPVTCKIRLLPTLQETILFAKGLQAAGCALLAVHGRQRGSVSRRRSGPADLRAVGALKRALAIPVLSNGNVRRAACVRHALVRTQADGVMVAEALLRYPALFAPDAPERPTIKQRRDVALEYLQLAETCPPPTIEYARAHLSCMLGRDGAGARLRYKHSHLPPPVLRAALQTADSIAALRVLAEQAFGAEFLPLRGNMGHVCRESLSKTCSARDGESHKAGDASYPVLITTDACAFECAHGAQPALHAVQTKPVDGDKLSSADCDERAVAKAAVPLGSSKPKVVALWAKGRLLFKRLPSDEDQAGSTGRRVCLRSTDQAFGM